MYQTILLRKLKLFCIVDLIIYLEAKLRGLFRNFKLPEQYPTTSPSAPTTTDTSFLPLTVPASQVFLGHVPLAMCKLAGMQTGLAVLLYGTCAAVVLTQHDQQQSNAAVLLGHGKTTRLVGCCAAAMKLNGSTSTCRA